MSCKKECGNKANEVFIRIVNNKTIEFRNNELEYTMQEMDNCKEIANETKCDYKISILNHEHYIELKGSSIPKSLKQIENTVMICSNCSSRKKLGIIVLGSMTNNPLALTGVQRQLKILKDEYDISISITEYVFVYEIIKNDKIYIYREIDNYKGDKKVREKKIINL